MPSNRPDHGYVFDRSFTHNLAPLPRRLRPLEVSGSCALLLAAVLTFSACGSEEGGAAPAAGQGGSAGRGGSGGNRATGGSSGSGGGTGGSTGGATGGSGGASTPGSGGGGGGGGGGGAGGGGGGGATVSDGGASDGAAGQPGSVDGGRDMGSGSGDGPPVTTRPDAAGAACAIGQRYAFTIRPFMSQTGTFTAYFTVTPSNAPTNSVIGLSDGQKYLHDDFAAIIRFGTNGNIDARNGTAYTALTPIKYMVTDYHFRLVVNVATRTYAAYVSWGGMPEVTIGTDLAFRDSSGMPTQLNYWGVEAIAPHMTKVCGFLIQ